MNESQNQPQQTVIPESIDGLVIELNQALNNIAINYSRLVETCRIHEAKIAELEEKLAQLSKNS
jgi:hypothetical protein